MKATFRRGTAHFDDVGSSKGVLADAYMLPEEDRERLCRSLLAEFGVTHIRLGGRGELIHGCVLPFGSHKDQDRNPTASLNYEKLVYNCFGCGSGGSILWFVGLMRDVSGTEARRWLESQTGIGEDEKSLANLMDYFDSIYSKESKIERPMPSMDPKVLEPWRFIHPYLTEIRGIPEDVLIKFDVGYGVIRVRVDDGKFVNSHRVIIPHFWKGKLVGWQSRRLINDGTSKYLSSPDFPKDRTLYNFDQKAQVAVIVESPMSVLSKQHLGHMEATFGASITDKQKRLISIHRKVILFLDNDEAGWKATMQLGDYLMNYSEVMVATNPYNADAADFTDDVYTKMIDEAERYELWVPPANLEKWEPEKESV